ncbi:unnamed protein product [Adineta steineri]|uniref:Uncharacterized protein n=1 Tax=Adineta steineri TaxID=433720 RepID=A0A814CM19_9BILA|nr:unnamed protein product [Adineta steineri]CAF0941855.1 unnamed protein product [Adineta steineri]
MTLESRLSTQANIGDMDKNSELRSMIIRNIILTRLQAIVVGFLAALVSLTMKWVSRGHFNLRYTLVLFINISHFVVESCYLLLSFHINIKSIATSLDDSTTLGILASIGEFLFKIIDNYTWLSVMITIIFLIITPIWIIISFGNEYVKDVLTHEWFLNDL